MSRHSVSRASGTTAASIGHILVPLDGSPLAESILPVAVALSRAFAARVTLLHVLESPRGGRAAPRPVDPLEWEMTHTEIARYLELRRQQLGERGTRAGRGDRPGSAGGADPPDGAGTRRRPHRPGEPWGRAGPTPGRAAPPPSASSRSRIRRSSSCPRTASTSRRADGVSSACCCRSTARRERRRRFRSRSRWRCARARRSSSRTWLPPPSCHAASSRPVGTARWRRSSPHATGRKRGSTSPGWWNGCVAQGVRARAQLLVSGRLVPSLLRLADDESVDLTILTAHGCSGDPQERHGTVACRFLRDSRRAVLVCQDMTVAVREHAARRSDARESRAPLTRHRVVRRACERPAARVARAG